LKTIALRYSDEIALLIFLLLPALARGQESRPIPAGSLQVSVFGDYNTSAWLYPASRDDDPVVRTTYYDMGGFLSIGGEVRMNVSRSNMIGVLFQPLIYRKVTETIFGYDRAGNYVGVPVNDGFSIFVTEVNGFFNIPIVEGDWRIYLGGGPSFIYGRRELSIGSAAASTPYVSSFGIQVMAGASWNVSEVWGLRAEMKFRSPELNTASSFNSSSTTYNGVTVALPGTMYSKINVNGADFILSAFIVL